MSGCLDGYTAITRHILEDITVDDVLKELSLVAERTKPDPKDAKPVVVFSKSDSNPNPIITMKDGQFSHAEAMAIHGDKIIAVGMLKDVQTAAGSDALPHDLGSQVVVPGFIEPHLHIILSDMLKKFLENFDPLFIAQQPGGGPAFEDAMAYIASKAKGLKDGQWLLGFGFDPSRYATIDGKFQDLTWTAFDKYGINDTNPIFITNASGHLAYGNKKAFDIAGISSIKPPPPTDWYPQDPPGTYLGICVEAGSYKPFTNKAWPRNLLKVGSIWEGMQASVAEWSKVGFTTVFDAGVGMNAGLVDVAFLDFLARSSPLRIAGAAANLTAGAAAKTVGASENTMPPNGVPPLNIKTIKLWMDGSTQGFTAALEDTYEANAMPDYFKNPNGWARWEVYPSPPNPKIDAEQGRIVDEMRIWAKAGYQLMVHVNGDCASQVVLDALAALKAEGSLPADVPLHRLEHFTVTSKDQVKQCKDLNLAVSHTIGHVKYWGDSFEQNILGDPRAQRIDPVKDDIDNGVVYSFNSDSPVSQADALSFVSTAAGRWLYDNNNKLIQPPRQLRDKDDDQCVTIEAALAGVTINPAKQILLADQIGSLEVKKDANFVVLTKDISAEGFDPLNISSDLVAETWYEGVMVHSASST